MRWMLNKPPYEVQRRALEKSEGRVGYNWWMEVGLGKTATALNEWYNDYDEGRADYHVVITLNSFKNSWVEEARNWGAPDNYVVWSDKNRDLLPKGAIGCIMNWEALIGSGGEALANQVFPKRRVRIDFDEAHKIKNPTSKVAKIAINLWKDAESRRGLTGTPITNTVMDMYVPLKLGEQLNGKNMFAFKGRYAQTGGYMGKSIVGIKPERMEELAEIRDRAGFIAKKKDWLNLPEQTWRPVVQVPLHPKLVKPYREMLTDFYTILSDDTEIDAEMVVTQLLKLQQIAMGFVMRDGEEYTLLPMSENPKYKAVLDILEQNGPQYKALIFTHFSWTTREVYEALVRDFGPNAVTIMRGKGKARPDENDVEKKRFNGDRSVRFMVAQASVASEAHTLLGLPDMRCNCSIFLENTYELKTRIQAEGRNHRGGQTVPVDYWDIACSVVDRKTLDALAKKTDLKEAVMAARAEGPPLG